MSKYKGYSNFETWRVHLEFFNGLTPEWITGGDSVTAEDLRQYDELKGWAWAFLPEVDFQEIADAVNRGLSTEDMELLDRYAERCQYGWIVDPDGRRELFRDADKALLEIDWLLEATDLESEYPAK